MAELDILSPEFTREAEAAWDRARNQALARGVPVFYRNDRTGLEIMEQPDGRRFEIRFIPGAPRGRNFEIIRELARASARSVPVLTVIAGPSGSGKSTLTSGLDFAGRENLLDPTQLRAG